MSMQASSTHCPSKLTCQSRAEGRRWQLERGVRNDFAELVKLLKRRAAELVDEHPQTVHGLGIIGIDFSDPLEAGP